jgi:Glutaredoxin and related proteins
LAQISGATQCPYLVDPNTNVQMAESKDIIQYLYQQYAIYTPPNELLGMISGVITPVLKPFFKVLAPLQAGSSRENQSEYEAEIKAAKSEILEEISSEKVVIYTYSLSPFCSEALKVLDSLEILYREISLGLEWVPFLIKDNGSQKRVALGVITGQTSLPNIFVNGKSIGGLYEGLLPALEEGKFQSMLNTDDSNKRVESVEGVFE